MMMQEDGIFDKAMNTGSKEYQEHDIFKRIEEFIESYDFLSGSVFQYITMGTKSAVNIDSYMFMSIKGTLDSIQITLQKGRISDAYALLRKLHDCVMINIYMTLYLDEKFSLENFIVQEIQDWMTGKKSLPEYRILSRYIRANQKVMPINDLLFNTDNRYEDIRNRCNDYTHYNFFKNMLVNDSDVYLENRLALLDSFLHDIIDILILHLGYTFYFNEHYMRSSDYVDALDCGSEPEEESLYWVSPFAQKIFDEVLKKNRPDLAEVIKSKTAMHLA